MQVTVQKWGNSLAVRLPKAVAVESELAEGTPVELKVRGGKVILTPVRSPKHTLAELLAGVKKENLHCEFQSGPALGKEAW